MKIDNFESLTACLVNEKPSVRPNDRFDNEMKQFSYCPTKRIENNLLVKQFSSV